MRAIAKIRTTNWSVRIQGSVIYEVEYECYVTHKRLKRLKYSNYVLEIDFYNIISNLYPKLPLPSQIVLIHSNTVFLFLGGWRGERRRKMGEKRKRKLNNRLFFEIDLTLLHFKFSSFYDI